MTCQRTSWSRACGALCGGWVMTCKRPISPWRGMATAVKPRVGMYWTLPGAQALLNLCCVALNDEWEPFINYSAPIGVVESPRSNHPGAMRHPSLAKEENFHNR